jgi:DnaJ-class molecular chaperone
MKRLALPILIAVGVTFLMLGALSAKEHTVVLENKFGNVTFEHQKHSDQKCQDCHHSLAEGDESPQPCGECHKSGAEVTAKKAFHDTCKSCHTKVGKGPTKCKECHVK